MKLGVVWLVLVLVLVLAHMWFSRGSSWVRPNMHECCMLWHVWCHVLWHVCMVGFRMVRHVWFTCCGMVVGGSTLVQLWGTLLWPRVIGPDLFQLWFSCVWSDGIGFRFGSAVVQLVVVMWFSDG